MLRLYLFGAPQIELNGQPVALRRTKALALLAYLAVTGQPQERSTLLNLLWPEFDEASARNNLRRELSLLRNLLGDAVLTTGRQQISVAEQADVWVDAVAFTAQIATAQQLPSATAEWAAALGAAVAFAGADFLGGFNLSDSLAFEEWQFYQREQLRQQLAEALAALVAWHRDTADYSVAIGYARRRLALDALHEPAQRELIYLYAIDGRYAAAMRQYETCVRLLDTELGVVPEPDTQELYAAIKARRLDRSPAGAAPQRAGAVVASQSIGDLPALVSDFVGRERELALIAELLADPQCRLLTFTGPGGVGKTQLALHTAQWLRSNPAAGRRFADGIAFVSLATVTAVDRVLPTIMQALKIVEQSRQTSLEALSAFLRERRLLLILDNLEQVVGVAPELALLIAAAPQLTLLTTSREALRVRAEQIVPVAPLSLPHETALRDPQTVLTTAAVQLFVRRAQQVRPDFALTPDNLAAVGAICRHLDGLPLAIELAAARVRMFPPQELAARLEHRLPLLTGDGRDGVERHRTLRNAIGWSYDLLNPAEQRLFRQLAIFVGGATLEAIAAICQDQPDPFAALEPVEALLARSLIIQEEHDGEARFTMLATIHEYAEELLRADSEQEALEVRHAQYYARWVDGAHAELYRAQQQQWRARLVREHDNLRAILQRSRQRGDATMLLRVTGRLGRFWGLQGYLCEGREWLETAIGAAVGAQDGPLRARAELSLGNVCWMQSDLAAAASAFAASLAHYQELGDQYGTAQALNGLGITQLEFAHYAEAQPYFAESLALFRALGDQERIATLLNNYAIAVEGAGDRAQARQAFTESMALQQALGNDAGYALALNNLARIDFEEGRQTAAYEAFVHSAALNRKLGNAVILASALTYLGLIAAEQDDYATAQDCLAEAFALGQQFGSAKSIVDTLEGWAFLAFQADHPLAAVQFFAAAMRMREQSSYFQEADGTALAATREYLHCVLSPDAWAGAWQRGWHADVDALLAEFRTTPKNSSRRAAHAT
jgi:predicted ATPase/DNA-binding SARP family transcriptional activator